MSERIDVVMLIYNALPHTAETLLYLLHSTPAEVRLILVDNGSSEPALPKLRNWLGSSHIYIRHDHNLGVYPALNDALSLVETDLAILCASDHLPLPGWLTPLISCVREHGFSWVGPEWTEGPHAREAFWNALPQGGPVAYAMDDRHYQASLALFDWKTIKAKVGYFDERFHIVYGDDDYAERLLEQGLKFGILHGSRSHHQGCQSSRALGLDAFVDWQIEDATAFRQKWGHRPDVMGRHAGVEFYTPENREHVKAVTGRTWAEKEKT